MTARAPLAAALRPYVGSLWVGHSVRARREHVIPSGEMHLAVRIDGPPLQLYAGRGDRAGQAIDTAVVCGARSRYYAKRTEPGCTVGAQLLPGEKVFCRIVSCLFRAGRRMTVSVNA